MKGYGEHTTARLDVTYMCSKNGQPNTNPMDICSDSGMAILGLNHYSQKKLCSLCVSDCCEKTWNSYIQYIIMGFILYFHWVICFFFQPYSSSGQPYTLSFLASLREGGSAILDWNVARGPGLTLGHQGVVHAALSVFCTTPVSRKLIAWEAGFLAIIYLLSIQQYKTYNPRCLFCEVLCFRAGTKSKIYFEVGQ